MQIVLDGRTIYSTAFRACKMERTDANTNREAAIMRTAHFQGGHTFQKRYRTKPGEKIECDIWQAGADADGIVLGVSFDDGHQILLNTLDIVTPGKPTTFTLDRGLVAKTYPLK